MKLERIGESLRDINLGNKLALVTDTNIKDLYLPTCLASLEKEGFSVETFVMEAGEKSKNLETYGRLMQALSDIPLSRDDAIVALGGGVVGDLAGFAAASYMRGIKLIQVPTSLVAYVDSSIGGKTGLDLPQGKNLVGAFHQAAYIFRDLSLLESLPRKEFLNGMAEIIKYGIIEDEELFTMLFDIASLRDNLPHIVGRSIEIKEEFVQSDLLDRGKRQMLNFGHTVGHAVEQLSNYEVMHGYAVGKGMMMEAEIGHIIGLCGADTLKQIRDLLMIYGFDLDIEYDALALTDAIKRDKKRRGDLISMTFPEIPGTCLMKKIPIKELSELMSVALERRKS